MAEKGTMRGTLVLRELETPKGPYSYGSQTGGTMALLLPYRKRMGAVQYLMRREFIPCWDSHMDTCGIAVLGPLEALEAMLAETLKLEAGYAVKPEEIRSLGVCAADRHTDTTCYLYAVDLSRHNAGEEKLEVSEELTFWGTAQDILESVDSQLIACYAKAQYLII